MCHQWDKTNQRFIVCFNSIYLFLAVHRINQSAELSIVFRRRTSCDAMPREKGKCHEIMVFYGILLLVSYNLWLSFACILSA